MPAITKSRAKLSAWEWTRELDRLALPLIPKVGVAEAYRMAAEKLRCS